MRNRKEEILIVALHLFARDGYEAVSVSQIAGELEMTKKGHCIVITKAKEIFLTVLCSVWSSRTVSRPERMKCQKRVLKRHRKNTRTYHWMILWNTASLCLNTGQWMILHHHFGKMLTIEQFRSEEMQNLYQQYLYPDRQNT